MSRHRNAGTSPTVALMRRMGSADGAFDPMPPDQYMTFAACPDLMLTQTEMRVLSWVQSKTLHLDPDPRQRKKQERTPQAKDERGDLTARHCSDDLEFDLANVSRALAELERLGFLKRDQKGVIWLSATVPKPERIKSETEKRGCLYKPLPEYVDAHIKGLSADHREMFLTRWYAAEKRARDEFAQARVAIYEREMELKAAAAKAVGLELNDAGGRPRMKTGGDRPQLVQITFLGTEDGFVQTTDVRTSGAGLAEAAPEFVRENASLLSFESEERVSECRAETAANGVSEAHSPTVSNKDGEAQTDPVIEAAEEHFGPLPKIDKVRRELAELAGENNLPAASVARALHEKWESKRRSGYEIESPGALLHMLREDLPKWAKRNPQQIEIDRRYESPAAPTPPAEPVTDDEYISRLERMLELSPNHAQANEWRDMIARAKKAEAAHS